MAIGAVIVDDEVGARESLYNIISRYFPEIEVLAKADSAKSGIEAILANSPELVFLDIEMPGGNAFDMLSSPKFGGKVRFEVIFVTAFDHYAVQAIRFSALDYLLKPIDMDDLREAVARFLKKKKGNHSFNEKLDVLLDNLKAGKTDGNRKIAIPDMEGLSFILMDDIIHLESDGNYTVIHTMGGKKLVSSRSLTEYDEILSDEHFFRIHRSHLINLVHIKKYYRGEGGYVVMSNDSQIEVSRRKKNEFLEKVGK